VLLSTVLLADKYVRDGGTSSACTTWTDACDQITTAEGVVSRGETIWVSDGTYNGATLDVANSGTAVITVKKATIASHGTEAGWDNAYGDGQATVSGDFILGSDYWTIDGVSRNESDWTQLSAYGFRIGGISASTSFTTGVCSSNLTVQYADIGGSDVGNTFTGAEPSSGFYIGGFDEFCNNWTLSRNRVHNVIVPFHMNGTDTGTIEYTHISNSFGKEAVRGQIGMANYTIRHNVFANSCQRDPNDETSGCTAEIAIWDGDSAGVFSGNKIYGNLIYKTTSEPNCCGSIVVGGNGSSWVGVSASNTLIYNNTIAGIHDGSASANILVNGGTGNEVRNTIWYDCIGTPSATPNTSSNGEESTSPFINYAGLNFHLTAALAGTSISTPYDADMDGVTRGADGTFDRGAFEYQAGGATSGSRSSGSITREGPISIK